MADEKKYKNKNEKDGRDLSPEELKVLKEKSAEFKKAQKQVTDALAVMWNARLDVAIATGKPKQIDDALKQPPVALWNDCDCNVKECGTPIITT